MLSDSSSSSSSSMATQRRPRGILVRNPSADNVIKCVKWKQCEAQIFEVEQWDRSPCPVTPRLTYRDLVELKQLELHKVPQSPFKSLEDLQVPVGLPRVRVSLQPIFEPKHAKTPASSPNATPPRADSPCSSNPSSPTSNGHTTSNNSSEIHPSPLKTSSSPTSTGNSSHMGRSMPLLPVLPIAAQTPQTPSSGTYTEPPVSPPESPLKKPMRFAFVSLLPPCDTSTQVVNSHTTSAETPVSSTSASSILGLSSVPRLPTPNVMPLSPTIPGNDRPEKSPLKRRATGFTRPASPDTDDSSNASPPSSPGIWDPRKAANLPPIITNLSKRPPSEVSLPPSPPPSSSEASSPSSPSYLSLSEGSSSPSTPSRSSPLRSTSPPPSTSFSTATSVPIAIPRRTGVSSPSSSPIYVSSASPTGSHPPFPLVSLCPNTPRGCSPNAIGMPDTSRPPIINAGPIGRS